MFALIVAAVVVVTLNRIHDQFHVDDVYNNFYCNFDIETE